MPGAGPSETSATGLFRSAWRPKKAVIILWRRVETLSPDAYTELMEWVRTQAGDGETWRWLEAMATNETAIDATEAIGELTRLLQRRPPEPIREHAQLLRDLIWEASEPTSDWLTWRACQVCGRHWAVVDYEGVPLCPQHANPQALMHFLSEEGERFPGLVNHAARLAALSTQRGRGTDDPSEPLPPAGMVTLNGAELRSETQPLVDDGEQPEKIGLRTED